MFAPNKSLYIGLLLAAPFFVLNALVVSGARVAEIIRSTLESAGYAQVFILGLLALVFVGGIVALYPVITTRRLLILNIVVGLVLVGFATVAGYGLGKDVYHCDVLKIPNCD